MASCGNPLQEAFLSPVDHLIGNGFDFRQALFELSQDVMALSSRNAQQLQSRIQDQGGVLLAVHGLAEVELDDVAAHGPLMSKERRKISSFDNLRESPKIRPVISARWSVIFSNVKGVV